MFSYFTKILKSSEYQSVLKVYYLTKNRQKWVKSTNIRKLQITDYQYNIFFSLLLFLRHCTGSGYKTPIVSSWFTIGVYFIGIWCRFNRTWIWYSCGKSLCFHDFCVVVYGLWMLLFFILFPYLPAISSATIVSFSSDISYFFMRWSCRKILLSVNIRDSNVLSLLDNFSSHSQIVMLCQPINASFWQTLRSRSLFRLTLFIQKSVLVFGIL